MDVITLDSVWMQSPGTTCGCGHLWHLMIAENDDYVIHNIAPAYKLQPQADSF